MGILSFGKRKGGKRRNLAIHEVIDPDYAMARDGLGTVPATLFSSAVLSVIIERDDLSAEMLDRLANRIGRLAHERARKPGIIYPPEHEAESYHLPHMHGEIDWRG